MDRENFSAIIDKYLQNFERTNSKPHEEYFKWLAIARFQKFWDVDADDFAKMFDAATQGVKVLFEGGHSAPIAGITELLKMPEEVEKVRAAFQTLFSDDRGNLSLRQKHAEGFIDAINERVSHYWKDSHLYRQTMRSAIGYLTMAKPAENYFYLYTKAQDWANCVEYNETIGSGEDFLLSGYYQMCDELIAEINSRPELAICNEKRIEAAIEANKDADLTEKDYAFADGYHTLAYDMIYCATTYDLYADIPHYPKSESKRIERARERKELSELQEAFAAAQHRYDCAEEVSRPEKLIGCKVQHKAFGEGVIRSYKDAIQEVDFGGNVKRFLYPDAYVQRMLLAASEGDARMVEECVAASVEENAAKTDLKYRRADYETAKASFEKKWVKNAKAEKESADDE